MFKTLCRVVHSSKEGKNYTFEFSQVESTFQHLKNNQTVVLGQQQYFLGGYNSAIEHFFVVNISLHRWFIELKLYFNEIHFVPELKTTSVLNI